MTALPTLSQVEGNIEETLGELREYYRNNSVCRSWQDTNHRTLYTEQRGKEIIESIMEWSWSTEYYQPQILRCDFR